MKRSLFCREICTVVINKFSVDGTGHYLVQHCTMVELLVERKKKGKYPAFMDPSATESSLW